MFRDGGRALAADRVADGRYHGGDTLAMRAGVTPKVQPVRGGTDGAVLSFMGLPCPNLGTGGFAFHGPYEHITVEGMDKVVQMLLNLVKIYSGCENMSCDA